VIDPTPRWRYRSKNLSRALLQLQDGVVQSNIRTLSDLEAAGLVQTFEYTWELARNLLRDLLRAGKVELKPDVPAIVIREAFKAGLIEDGEGWMAALKTRNDLSHVYSISLADDAVTDIRFKFTPLLVSLQARVEQLPDDYPA